MDSRQESYLSMANKTVGEMNEQKERWKGNTIIADTLKFIIGLIVNIGETDAIKLETSKGYTKMKKMFRNQLNITTDVFFGIFRSFAKTTGDEVLYENSKHSLTYIRDIKDNEIMITVNATKSYATKHLEKLKDYGMEEKMIEKYGKEANGYINYFTTPQQLAARKKAATAELKELFKDLDEQFIEHLNNHMMQYKTKDKKFYAIYLNARIIYDDPSHKDSLYGTILGEETELPVVDVKVTASCLSDPTIDDIVKMTSDLGNYEFTKLKPGVYKVTYEKLHFDTITIEIEIFKGKGYRRDQKIRKTE